MSKFSKPMVTIELAEYQDMQRQIALSRQNPYRKVFEATIRNLLQQRNALTSLTLKSIENEAGYYVKITGQDHFQIPEIELIKIPKS